MALLIDQGKFIVINKRYNRSKIATEFPLTYSELGIVDTKIKPLSKTKEPRYCSSLFKYNKIATSSPGEGLICKAGDRKVAQALALDLKEAIMGSI